MGEGEEVKIVVEAPEEPEPVPTAPTSDDSPTVVVVEGEGGTVGEHAAADVDRWVENAKDHAALEERVRKIEERDWSQPTYEEVRDIVDDAIPEVTEPEPAPVSVEVEPASEGEPTEVDIAIDVPDVSEEVTETTHKYPPWDIFGEMHGKS